MAEGRKLSLSEYRARLSASHPEFAAGLREEEAHLAQCGRVRDDLRQLRELLEVSQAELAERLGATQSAVSRLENGGGDIGLLTICRYAAALGLRPTVSFVPNAASYADAPTLARVNRAVERLSAARREAIAEQDALPVAPGAQEAVAAERAVRVSEAMAQQLLSDLSQAMSAYSAAWNPGEIEPA